MKEDHAFKRLKMNGFIKNIKNLFMSGLGFLLCFHVSAANRPPVALDYNINILRNLSASEFRGEWLLLGSYEMPGFAAGSYNPHCERSITSCVASYLNTGAGVGTAMTFWKPKLQIAPVTVTAVNNGEPLVFSAYFRDSIAFGAHERWAGFDGYTSWEIDYTQLSKVPGETLTIEYPHSSGKRTSLVCYDVYSCTDVALTTYFLSTPKPVVYVAVKLPEKTSLKAKTYDFDDVPILTMGHTQNTEYNTRSVTVTSTFYITGRITIPERCYINTSRQSEIIFRDVSSGEANGEIENKEFVLDTTCQGIVTDVRQYVKVTTDTGLLSTNESFVDDNSGNTALGLAMKILLQGEAGKSDCSQVVGSEKVQFNREYYLRTIAANYHGFSFQDKISFSLCKFGIPKDYGEKTMNLNVVTRWEY